jgi:hypothetical protein
VITFNKITFHVDSVYLWAALAFAIVIFSAVAIVLHFHWNNYSLEDSSKKVAKSFFWIVSFSLIFLATVCLLIFETGVK